MQRSRCVLRAGSEQVRRKADKNDKKKKKKKLPSSSFERYRTTCLLRMNTYAVRATETQYSTSGEPIPNISTFYSTRNKSRFKNDKKGIRKLDVYTFKVGRAKRIRRKVYESIGKWPARNVIDVDGETFWTTRN